MIETPLTLALDDAGVDNLVVPDADIDADALIKVMDARAALVALSEKYIDALHRIIAVAKQTFDKPSTKNISTAHYAFLKER